MRILTDIFREISPEEAARRQAAFDARRKALVKKAREGYYRIKARKKQA